MNKTNNFKHIISAQGHVYSCAGSPAVACITESCSLCATCGSRIKEGISISKIENPTFSQHADFLKYSDHVCQGCAWLYWSGKGKPGNFLAANGEYKLLVISHDSVVKDKENWYRALTAISKLPCDTLVCGVLTTDVKPRLWPRTKLSTVGNFGLYVHAPDYDLSSFVMFDLYQCLYVSSVIKKALLEGYAKRSVYFGLLRDHARSSKNISLAMDIESELSTLRLEPEFIPALIVSGISKEEKNAKTTRQIKPTAKVCHPIDKTQSGLF